MSAARLDISLTVNGEARTAQVPPLTRLSTLLRDSFGLTGTKSGCDAGDCGACTVELDGRIVCACLVPAAQADGRRVRSVEGLANGALTGLQQAFLNHGAAQCGVCTPGMLMAAASLLERNPHPREAEVEEALSGVLCRCTGYRKIVRAVMDAGGATAGPAVPGAGCAVGARIARLDGVARVDGTERFGADGRPEGALLVRAVRSPHFSASFAFGDLAAYAAEHPGICAVLTAKDIPGRNCFGVIPPFADQPALAEDVVRFKGEAVAIVVGEPEAVSALDLARFPVTWTPNGHMLDPDEALADGAPLIHRERAGNLLTEGIVARGAPKEAIAGAAHVVEGGIETSYVEHAYIEPEAGWAVLDGDTIVVSACTQAPHMDRDDLAVMFDRPKEKVRVIPSAVGGGFGSKLDVSLQPYLALAAIATGRPAYMTYSRAESMMSTTKRHPARMRGKIAADADGRVTAMEFDGVFNTGAYASWGPTVANRVPVHASGPYYTPNYRAFARAVHSNGPVSGAFRGFGVPQAAILQEVLYDELAARIGMDRLDFRILNAITDGRDTVTGQVMQGGTGIRACLEKLAPAWREASARAASFNAAAGTVRRGIGVASCWYGCGNTALPNPSTIRLGLTAEGEAVLHQGAVDIGQGSNTVITQICADALGLPVSAFRLVGGDTAVTPDAGKTSASRQTYISGNAALLAGRALRETILRQANASPDARLSLAGSRLTVEDGDGARAIDLSERPVGADGYVWSAEESYDPPTTPLDANGQGSPYAVYGWGAQMAELEVDMALGTVKLVRITAAHDVGRAINPVLAEGQIEGGIAQGIGLALMEEYVPGRTENLHDYLIPTIGDVPEIETFLVEIADPQGPFGAKGLGEHALIPTAPAILNAIHHATGARLQKVPATPDRVLAAIGRAKAGRP